MNEDRQFQIGEVKFEVQTVPPLEGWDVCELFREAVGASGINSDKVTIDEKNPRGLMHAIIGLLTSMPRTYVVELRKAFFKYVTFKAPEQMKFIPLSGVEDMAFKDLDAFAIYEVMVRVFKVNFMKSFIETLNRLGLQVSKVTDSDSNP